MQQFIAKFGKDIQGVMWGFDRVLFRGNEHVSEAELRKRMKLLEGMTYDNDILQRDIREMVKAYSPLGYIYQSPQQGSSCPRWWPRRSATRRRRRNIQNSPSYRSPFSTTRVSSGSATSSGS